jgi:hypothetical protein
MPRKRIAGEPGPCPQNVLDRTHAEIELDPVLQSIKNVMICHGSLNNECAGDHRVREHVSCRERKKS